jgi:zinc D-Ala-D-Ala carboxypeptidase
MSGLLFMNSPYFLSRFFTLNEMTHSQTAVRKGLRNDPNKAQVMALNALCINILDPLREGMKSTIQINSGFRSLVLNWQIGGSSTSQHCKGEAADLVIPGMDLMIVARQIVILKLPFDQMIYEGTWLHVSHAMNGRQRGQVLKATFKSAGVSYAPLQL